MGDQIEISELMSEVQISRLTILTILLYAVVPFTHLVLAEAPQPIQVAVAAIGQYLRQLSPQVQGVGGGDAVDRLLQAVAQTGVGEGARLA